MKVIFYSKNQKIIIIKINNNYKRTFQNSSPINIANSTYLSKAMFDMFHI